MCRSIRPQTPAPSAGELQQLVQRIATRIGRSLERAGLITRDIENAYLAFDPAEEKFDQGRHSSTLHRPFWALGK